MAEIRKYNLIQKRPEETENGVEEETPVEVPPGEVDVFLARQAGRLGRFQCRHEMVQPVHYLRGSRRTSSFTRERHQDQGDDSQQQRA